VRNGFVEVFDPNEIRIKRNGKIGYRTKGVRKGPLRNLSFLERRLIEKEQDFFREIAKFTKLDNAMRQLAAKQRSASAIAVKQRSQKADAIGAIVFEMYAKCRLPRHLRAGYITRKLPDLGWHLSERRVRQIIFAHFPAAG
jgi:hypothetical protein